MGISEDGILREVRVQDPGGQDPQILDSVFLGRVTRVAPSLQAAFVRILPGVTGFLAARDARRRAGDSDERSGPIESLCHEGETLMVQVTADGHGDKGPRISTDITFAFEHLVVSPTRRGAVVSSRIHDKAERARLQALGDDLLQEQAGTDEPAFGLILRTQAADATRKVLETDFKEAVDRWSSVHRFAQSAQPETQLAPAPDAVDRLLKTFAASTGAFVTDDRALFQRLQSYFEPRGRRPILRLDAGRNLFEDEGLDDEIDAALVDRVALPGGGWISIGQTEALTAIDVNSGSGRAGSAQTQALRTNQEAAIAAAHQIRLRGLSGLFVIDLIEMKRDVDRESVRQTLIQELGTDPSPCRVGRFSDFGLLEFTRQRSGRPLRQSLTSLGGKN